MVGIVPYTTQLSKGEIIGKIPVSLTMLRFSLEKGSFSIRICKRILSHFRAVNRNFTAYLYYVSLQITRKFFACTRCWFNIQRIPYFTKAHLTIEVGLSLWQKVRRDKYHFSFRKGQCTCPPVPGIANLCYFIHNYDIEFKWMGKVEHGEKGQFDKADYYHFIHCVNGEYALNHRLYRFF